MDASKRNHKKKSGAAGSGAGFLLWCALLLGMNGLILSDAISLGEDGHWGIRPDDITQEQLSMLIWFMPLNLVFVGIVLGSLYALYCHLRGRKPDYHPVIFTDAEDVLEATYKPLPFLAWAYVMMFPVSLVAIFLSIILGAFVSNDIPLFTYLWTVIGIVFLALCIYKLGWNLTHRFDIRIERGSVSLKSFSDIPIHNVTRVHCMDPMVFAESDGKSESKLKGRQFAIYLVDHDGKEQVVELPRIRPTDYGKRLGQWMEEHLMRHGSSNRR